MEKYDISALSNKEFRWIKEDLDIDPGIDGDAGGISSADLKENWRQKASKYYANALSRFFSRMNVLKPDETKRVLGELALDDDPNAASIIKCARWGARMNEFIKGEKIAINKGVIVELGGMLGGISGLEFAVPENNQKGIGIKNNHQNVKIEIARNVPIGNVKGELIEGYAKDKILENVKFESSLFSAGQLIEIPNLDKLERIDIRGAQIENEGGKKQDCASVYCYYEGGTVDIIRFINS